MKQNKDEEMLINQEYIRPQTGISKKPCFTPSAKSLAQNTWKKQISFDQNSKNFRPLSEKQYPLTANKINKVSKQKFIKIDQKIPIYSQNFQIKNTLSPKQLNNNSDNYALHELKNKKTPKSFYHDSEALYKENLDVKTENTQLKQELQKLKIFVLNLEKEKSKFEKYIEIKPTILKQGQASGPQINDNNQISIINNLKRQLNDLQIQLKNKTEEINQIKKKTKATKTQELEIENEAFANEIIRLKNLREENNYINEKMQSVQQKDAKIQIQTLIRENYSMANLIKHLEEELHKENFKIKELEKNLKSTKKQMSMLNQIISKQTQELQIHKNSGKQFSYEETLNQIDREKQFTEEIANLKQQISIQQAQLSGKENQIKDLKNEKLDQQKDFQEQIANEKAETNQVLKQLEQQKRLYTELLEQYTKDIVNKSVEQSQIKSLGSFQKTIVSLENKKKLKVKKKEVIQTSQLIKYNLLNKQIQYEEIKELLFSEEMQQNEISTISELCSQLNQEPFSIKQNNELIKFCRYLVESNEEEFVIYDENRTQLNSLILPIFQNLVGKYSILTHKDELQFHSNVSAILDKQKTGFLEAIKIYDQQHHKTDLPKHLTTKETLEFALKYTNITFTAEETDYFFQKLYQQSQDFMRIPIENIYQTFNLEEQNNLLESQNLCQGKDDQDEKDKINSGQQSNEQE